jgi:hypothetical protein
MDSRGLRPAASLWTPWYFDLLFWPEDDADIVRGKEE